MRRRSILSKLLMTGFSGRLLVPRLLPAEGHELANQASRPVRPLSAFLRFWRGWDFRGQFFQENLAMAHDDRQQIVEIMGEPSGEAADGFHFLSLPELLFALPEGIFRPASFQSFVEIAQGSFDGRCKSPQALLENIVGGPALHHIDGELFALRPETKRNGTSGWRVRESVRAAAPVETRSRGIGQNKTESILPPAARNSSRVCHRPVSV